MSITDENAGTQEEQGNPWTEWGEAKTGNDENWAPSTQNNQDDQWNWNEGKPEWDWTDAPWENAIPYSRFKEVNSNFKKSQSRIAELEAEIESSRNSKQAEKKEEIDFDNLTPQELLDLATKNAVEKIKSDEKAVTDKQDANQKYISDKLQDFTDEWIKFKEDDLLEIALKTGWDVDVAMELYKKFNPTTDTTASDKAKADARAKRSESIPWNAKNWGAKKPMNTKNVWMGQISWLYSQFINSQK